MDSAPNRLRGWRRAAGITVPALAARLEVTQAAVEHWLSGRRIPTGAHAAAIERLTGGLIPAAAWYEAAA
ncbi:MAG: YdaS family helix-turn-helix protein [Myxococcota bacterium]|nr:YdaS family helix-turn-helix protein [Myxococcota bacterium]